MAFRTAAIAAILVLAAPWPVQAQDVSPALTARAQELLPILNGEGAVARTFSRPFLAEVSEAKLRAVATSVRKQLGKAIGYKSVRQREPLRAELVIAYERGTAHGGLVVGDDEAGRVTGFWIDSVEPAAVAELATIDDVASAIAALPGRTAFAVANVEGADLLTGHEADRPLAIGSAFKLVILAELVRAIDAGERRWEDTIVLGDRELPAGGFRDLAAGSQVTLRRLAEEMIRISDNSATDALLYALGRERVEGMQEQVGWRHAQANVPFLSTMELFKLKGVEGGALGRRYLDADVAARRRMLDGEVARLPGSAVGALFADGKPVMIDRLEWFASPADLVRTLGWFTARAGTPAGAEALRILAMNPGPAASLRERFAYTGYKGGSEPGVLNMTVLAQTSAGRWQAVTASWNDSEAGLDEVQLSALVTRALTILAGA